MRFNWTISEKRTVGVSTFGEKLTGAATVQDDKIERYFSRTFLSTTRVVVAVAVAVAVCNPMIFSLILSIKSFF